MSDTQPGMNRSGMVLSANAAHGLADAVHLHLQLRGPDTPLSDAIVDMCERIEDWLLKYVDGYWTKEIKPAISELDPVDVYARLRYFLSISQAFLQPDQFTEIFPQKRELVGFQAGTENTHS